MVNEWLKTTNPDKAVTFTNQAISGHWPWSNNIRYPAQLHTAQPCNIVLTDYRIVNSGRDDRALEALTRRIYTDNPGAVIVSPIIPSDANLDGVVDDLIQTDLDSFALAEYYGVHLVDYRQFVIDAVAGGDPLTRWISDTIHPTTEGQAKIESMIEAEIVANGWLTGENHATLPARMFDDGEYENAPTRILGNAYTARTGTGWTMTDTRIESNTAGDTVTFQATCSQFGIYNASSGYINTTVDVQIDGGDWVLAAYCTHNGYYPTPIPDYGAHTIVIRVHAGYALRIDEFWAI